MEAKYVIFDNKLAICFYKAIVHADIATMQHSAFEGN